MVTTIRMALGQMNLLCDGEQKKIKWKLFDSLTSFADHHMLSLEWTWVNITIPKKMLAGVKRRWGWKDKEKVSSHEKKLVTLMSKRGKQLPNKSIWQACADFELTWNIFSLGPGGSSYVIFEHALHFTAFYVNISSPIIILIKHYSNCILSFCMNKVLI